MARRKAKASKPPNRPTPQVVPAPSPAPAPTEPVDASGESSKFTKIPSESELQSRAAEIAQTESGKLPKKGSQARTEHETHKLEIQHFSMAQEAALKSMELTDMGMEKMDATWTAPLAFMKSKGADVKFKYSDTEAVCVQNGFYQIYARMDPETLARWGGIFAFFGLMGVMIAKVSLAFTCSKLQKAIDKAREKQAEEDAGQHDDPLAGREAAD